ncbi:hypothetical protein [Nocardia thraciensis]
MTNSAASLDLPKPLVVTLGVNVSTEYRAQRGQGEDAGYEVFESYVSAWKWYREAADGEVGEGAENPPHDLGGYRHVGDESVGPSRVALEVPA